MTLDELYKIIEDRKRNLPEGSYVASLFKKGKDRIIQKVGEEATEVVIAAKNEEKDIIISESADLLFHLLVMLSVYGIRPEDILHELDKRNINKKNK